MKKGQASMEFLSTYGFSILILLILLGILFGFQTFSPKKLLPEKCVLGTTLYCRDFFINNTHAKFAVDNALAENIELVRLHVNESGSSPRLTCTFGGANVTAFSNLTYVSTSCSGTGITSDDLTNFNTMLSYVEQGSSLEHTQKGVVQVIVH